MTLRDALDRTLLLMRDEVHDTVTDDELIAALTRLRVALIADADNIASHSAQTAFATAAMLMARSGHQVQLVCPPVALVGPQPPLGRGDLVEELARAGVDLLPGYRFATGAPVDEVDIAIALGNSEISVRAARRIRLNAAPWSGRLGDQTASNIWDGGLWPLGSMAAAGLAAAEAFKTSMRTLAHAARNVSRMETVFAPATDVVFELAPEGAPFVRQLGMFDCISGGAIINAILYTLARVPGVEGRARVVEPDTADTSNLNRYMLLRQSHLTKPKADDLAAVLVGSGLTIVPVPKRYELSELPSLMPLAASVLVGVDDIPTRWLVQRAGPDWLGVGATTHWSAMASFHTEGLGCAECLHPADDPGNAPIPTVAFVSFWAGLLSASYFLRHRAGRTVPISEQQVYLTALRPELPARSPVPTRRGCPSCAALRAPVLGKRA
jgi:ThiF family protein